MAASATIPIVLADDDDDIRAVIALRLRAEGHEVWEAAGGLQALDLVRRHRPSLLMLDLWMPDLDGLRVLEELGREAIGGRLKVVMLSANTEADARLEALAGGAVEYLVKAGSLDEMVAAVGRWAARAAAPPFEDDEGMMASPPAGAGPAARPDPPEAGPSP